MGNQEIKSAMSKIQDRDFDVTQLDEYEEKLWQEQTPEQLSGFDAHLNMEDVSWDDLHPVQSKLDLEISGIDNDTKRYSDQARQCWQSGFSTSEKKLETLKQGDYKQVVIPTNKCALKYESAMQMKVLIFQGLFFARHQGGSESSEDFFTFTKRYMAQQQPTFNYSGALGATLLATPETISTLMFTDPQIVKSTVQHLLAASDKIPAQKLFSSDHRGFQDDLIHQKLRRVLLSLINNQQTALEIKELSIRLLLRWGIIRASAEDLILAAQLQQQYRVDVSNELEFLCKQSEVFKKPILDSLDGNLERENYSQVQSRVSFDRGSDRAQSNNQYVTDGTKWFIYSDQRGMTRGSKERESGQWSCEKQASDESLREITMLCYGDDLLVRHKDAPNVPFQVFSKETLEYDADAQAYSVADGEEDYLKFTPLDTVFPVNEEEGNRWMRASPMSTDGENIYMLVQYKRSNYSSQVVKTVLETYEVSERKLRRVNDTTLYKDSEGTKFKGSRKDFDLGYLAQGGSIACNGQTLLFHSNHYMHCFNMSTGVRRRKEHLNSTALISTYDRTDNYYYHMDAACYSWIKRFNLAGYKARVIKKEVKELPDLPIVFDTHKSEMLAQILEQKKAKEDLQQEPEVYTSHLFEQLAQQDEAFDLYQPLPQVPQEENKHQQIDNVHEVCQAIIFSKMSTDAQSASYKVKSQGEKKLIGEEMLPFFKAPYAIYGSSSYLMQIRVALEEQIDKLNNGRITLMKQSNVLNLQLIYQANLDCLMACRIEMKQILPNAELKKIQEFQIHKLDSLQLFVDQGDKEEGDLNSEELFQLHIFTAAQRLNQTLEANLDAQTRTEKLSSIESSLSEALNNDESPEVKKMKRLLPFLCNKKALKDIFEGNQEEQEMSKQVLLKCLNASNQKLLEHIQASIQKKSFNPKIEKGIYKEVSSFVKAYCKELMVIFGNQILTILENQDIKQDGELSPEQQAKVSALKQAQARKKEFEEILYENFILISQCFKTLMRDLSKAVQAAKVYEWEDKETIAKFYTYLSSIFNQEHSLLRVILMFSLMVCAHKADVTWLDEVAEALRNCAEALDFYIIMTQNIPFSGLKKIGESDTFIKVIDQSQRAVCYAIGHVSYRLILLNVDDGEESKKLSKLSLLQGGIESRFIPSLSRETKLQIEGSFKITNDKKLQYLSQQDRSQVVRSANDTLLTAIIDPEKSNEKVEQAISILQEGLLTKRPMCVFARLGGDWGIKLSRATFSVILKFSESLDVFTSLLQDIELVQATVDQRIQGSERTKALLEFLRDIESNENLQALQPKWEQASQMRKWTQKVKLTISERVKVEVETQLRDEITAANPSKEPFTDPFNEEQNVMIESRFQEQFDREVELKYQQVISKSHFLIKLAVPRSFQEAQRSQVLHKSRTGKESSVNRLSKLLNPNKHNFVQVSPRNQNRDTVAFRNSQQLDQDYGSIRPRNRQTIVLVKDGDISKKDVEFDWRDRLKQWKQMQQTTGAVTSFDDQIRLQNQSVIFSVLGCLQASFSSEQLQEKIENCLMYGLRRSAGLHLLNFAMNLNYNTTRFLDMIQWLQGALRNNRMQSTHYLTGLDGCGITAEEGIQKQFFDIIGRIVHTLKHELLESSTEYVHMLNMLCWNFTREDHEHLTKLDLLRTLQRGDGNILHPIFRAWGQEDTNFSLKLTKKQHLCLASRLRQVFEFFTQNVLENIFVRKEQEDIDLGQEEKMLSKGDSLNKESSETLLAGICEILFANLNRYVRMKKLFPDDHIIEHMKERFAEHMDENDEDFTNYPHDIATYINKNGGERMVFGKLKLEKHMNELKVQMFIQKIQEKGFIDPNSELARQIRKVTQSTLMNANSLQNAIPAICQRKFKVVTAIREASWVDLGIQEPDLSVEQKAEIAQISIEELQKLLKALQKRREVEAKEQMAEQELIRKKQAEKEEKRAIEEAKRREQEAQRREEESLQAKRRQSEDRPAVTIADFWTCPFCTFDNNILMQQCEMCTQPKPQELPAQQSESSVSDAGPSKWNCLMCTYENDASDDKCDMCQSDKPQMTEPVFMKKPSEEVKISPAIPTVGLDRYSSLDSAPALQQFPSIDSDFSAQTKGGPQEEEKSSFVDLPSNEPKRKKLTLTDGILNFFKKDDAQQAEPVHGNEAIELVEEVKEEVKSASAEEIKQEAPEEDVKEDEEELKIQAEDDYKVRCRKYLAYIQGVQNANNDELSLEAKIQVEGHMYTETSLFRIVKALDQIISLSMERQEGLNIIQKFSNPECLKHIIELSVEASTQNQILIQKILQNILKLDLPQQILDTAVKLAQKPIKITSGPNEVEKLLATQTTIKFQGSPFLQLLFNRLEKSRKTFYQANSSEQPGLNSVIQETVRTIRTLYTEGTKNADLRKILNLAFIANIEVIQERNQPEIEAIMSLIPEASFQRLAIGTPCKNKDGKIFSVLGVFNSSLENNKFNDIPLYPNFSQEEQIVALAGLYYDQYNPERQDIVLEKMIFSSPLLDLDEEKTALAAEESIFFKPEAMRKLMSIVLAEQSAFHDAKTQKALDLLQTFVIRGIFNMTQALKGLYIFFLQNNDLMPTFLTFLLQIADQQSVSPDEQLVSPLMLELRADYLREAVMTSHKLTFGEDNTETSRAANIFSSDDGQQLYVFRSKLPTDFFYFRVAMQFGKGEESYIEGALVDSDPTNNVNCIFLVEPAKLMNPSQATLSILKYAKIVITDKTVEFDGMMKALKKEIRKDKNKWQACAETRFMTLAGDEDFSKLKAVIEAGSTFKNTEKENRAYLLAQIFNHLDPQIWEKIDMEAFRKKYADYDAQKSFTELRDDFVPKTLANLIEQKFGEEESFMIQIGMSEVLENIRGGQFQYAEEEKKQEEEKKGRDDELSSSRFMQEFQEDTRIVKPNFNKILTDTYALRNEVSEGFFDQEAPQKPDSDSYQGHFKSYIFNDANVSPADIKDTYEKCLKALRQSYSRRILLNIVANGQEGFDHYSKSKIRQKTSFAKLCDLVHNEFTAASHVNESFGNSIILEETKEQISSLLAFMKNIPGFQVYFLNDFMVRGHLTLEKASEESFTKLNQFTVRNLRKATEGVPALDPLSLIYFMKEIIELEYIKNDEEQPQGILTSEEIDIFNSFFDLTIGYAFIFKKQVDYFIGLDLLKTAKICLQALHESLYSDGYQIPKIRGLVTWEEAACKKLFNSKLAQCLAVNLNIGDGEQIELKDRQKLSLEIIVQILNIKNKLKKIGKASLPIGFEINSSLRKALKVYMVMEQGPQFDTLLNKMKLKIILDSSDAQHISHIARNYSTDDQLYDSKFQKTITAAQAMTIRLDNHTSKELIQIKKTDSDQGMILANVGAFKSGKNLSLHLDAGESATINFPVRPQIINYSGKLHCRGQDFSMDHESWTMLEDTAQCAVAQVYSCHEAAIYVSADDTIWGVGYRAQGQGRDNCSLRRIEKPDDCCNYKKIAHGKFFRVILTQEGKVFFNGQNRKYMYGSNMERNLHTQKFFEIQNNFYRLEDGDSIIDLTAGKHYTAVATANGKIYAGGYIFYRHFQDCRHNEEQNEDYPFELRMPNGYKATKVFGCERYNNIWMNAVNEQGASRTFGAGQNGDITGHDNESRTSDFKPLALPEGVYMTKITNQGETVHGIDNQQRLWIWGNRYAWDSEEDRDILYEGPMGQNSKPTLVKWFSEREMKVLDVASGYFAALVKVQDKDERILMYGMAQASEHLLHIGGSATLTSAFKHYISEININGSNVKHMAMGKKASYILMGAEKDEFKSIDPVNPDERGLIHFYQKSTNRTINGKVVKQWHFLTPKAYNAYQEALPNICYATRHPINWLIQKLHNHGFGPSDADLTESKLPDLQICEESDIVFHANAIEHHLKTTSYDAVIPRYKPLYFSKATISGREQQVVATEEEVFQGGQSWDMNPLIFYRVKSPAIGVQNLPCLNLSDHFVQKPERQQVSFTIMNQNIDSQEIEAIQIQDQQTVQRLEEVRNFTQEQDQQILSLLDQQIQSKNLNIYTCKANQFEVTKDMLKPDSSLKDTDQKTIDMRSSLLIRFSKVFSRALKYVSVEDRQVEGTVSANHYKNRNLVVVTAINQIVDKQLESIPDGPTPEITVNRRKAMEFQEAGKTDLEGKYSIFGQIIQQLKERCHDMSNFSHHSVDERCYKVNFQGEGSIDAGGPFRDSLVNIVQEMEDGLVPLLIKSPNNRNDHGANRDCYILNPDSTSPAMLEMYKYLGGFIAFGILSKSPVPLNLAPTVWKQILGEKMQLSDLGSVDAYSSQVLTDLKNFSKDLSDADFNESIDQTFTTVLSNGQEISLTPDGHGRKVRKQDIDEFIDLVVKARFTESYEQNKAIQTGMDTVFHGNLGHISYLTHEAIEIRACGAKFIETDRLKSITIYPNCEANHELIQRFWRVFESFSGEERALYLKFVWGRNRLPADLSKISRKHEVRLMNNLNETGFPQSHTCFNQLDIPYYRNDEICRQRLLQAAQLCGGIDTDNNNFAEE